VKPRRTLTPFVMQLPGALREVHCPKMELFVGRDGGTPVFTGVGTLHLSDPTSLRWTMMVANVEEAVALGVLTQGRDALCDPKHPMILRVLDYRGVEWNCGWVVPEVRPEVATHPRLHGSLESMVTSCRDEWLVAKHSGIELYFDPAPSVWLSEPMVTTTAIGNEVVFERFDHGREVFSVLGSTIEVSRDPMSDGLWILANTSEHLSHPYFEKWASEPLRILCGQLVYPRLVARNFGDGEAKVWFRRTCSLRSNVGGLRAELPATDPHAFWSLYKQCLSFLSRHRGADGHPLLDTNHLSRFHEEVIQAAGSSDWVLALAASSAIEGMCRLATEVTGLPTEFDAKAISDVTKFLQGTPGPAKLRDRLISGLAYMGRPSTRKFLDDLVDRQVIRERQRDAWVSVRNKVAHGRLDGAGSAEDEHANLVALLGLLNALTMYVVSGR